MKSQTKGSMHHREICCLKSNESNIFGKAVESSQYLSTLNGVFTIFWGLLISYG